MSSYRYFLLCAIFPECFGGEFFPRYHRWSLTHSIPCNHGPCCRVVHGEGGVQVVGLAQLRHAEQGVYCKHEPRVFQDCSLRQPSCPAGVDVDEGVVVPNNLLSQGLLGHVLDSRGQAGGPLHLHLVHCEQVHVRQAGANLTNC